MKKFIENFKDQAIKAKLNFMVKVSVVLMSILGIGALFGAWELNLQTKELHEWMNANNLIADMDYLTSEVRLKQYAHVISSSTAEFDQLEKELEDLKADDFIKKNLESLKVRYIMVDPVVFELEIDGSAIVTGVKTKGSVGAGKVKASSSVVLGMVGISMFITAIGLELNQEQFASQMVRFWHYVMKCAADVGTILWQTYRGMSQSRKIISSEFTQPYTGRNKVLKDYYKWRFTEGKIDEEKYNSIVNLKEEIEVEMTVDEIKELTHK